MRINVSNLKNEINKLTKLIDEYQDTYLNLYNELSISQIYWDDDISRKFNEYVMMEKIQVKTTVEELIKLKSIYEMLVVKYEMIGNRIEVIPKSKDGVIAKLNNYLDKLKQILELYNDVKFSDKSKELQFVSKHINKLKMIEKEVLSIKEIIIEKYQQIEEIESNINSKLSKIKLEYMNEIDINKFI